MEQGSLKNSSFNLKPLLVSLMVLILAVAMRGEWLVIVSNMVRQYKEFYGEAFVPKKRYFEGLAYYLVSSLITSFGIYFLIGGFLQWYFYVRHRNSSEDWKCQPKKFLSWKDEKHEILLGSANMALGATLSGLLSCYLMNGGKGTSFYYNVEDYGWLYFFISIPVLFLYQDAAAYYYHRALHLPFMYKNFHKMHHRYKQPTAFSATAMHPVEFLLFQIFLALPLFGPPIHWGVYTAILLYIYYYGMMDHSGIAFKHIWPWQPDTVFHDNHHKYFHVNFGFNTKLFDKLHQTARREDRIYNEKIFYGFGKKKEELSKEELKELEDE